MKRLALIFVIIFLACESPFSTQPTEDDIFRVTHNYNGEKIYIPTAVTIEWSKITITKFKEFLVERSAAYGDSMVWEERVHIPDSLQVTYTDIIDDDVTFQYRVRMVDQDDQFIHALSAPLEVPNVSSIKVPEQYDSLQLAFDSHFIDDGDTINVFPGLYRDHFKFLDKKVVIRGVLIPEITVLGAAPDTGSVVTINKGQLVGFTVTGGRALAGGGVHASGTAIIRNCIIRSNRAVSNDTKTQIYPYGMGGGVYLQNNALLEKCSLVNNISQVRGGGILSDGQNSIINCNIRNNYTQIPGSGAGLYQHDGQLFIRNTKFNRNSTNREGGAIIINSDTEINNCLFEKNRSGLGGALIIGETGNANIVNCVFYRNITSSRSNSGAIVNNGNITILNSIVWKNGGEDDYKLYPTSAIYTLSDEFRVVSGNGNINLNPLFMNADRGDYHLFTDSPALNAGHPGDIFKDVNGTRNDMGIYGGPYGDDW
ncbi:MAG: hypothetical protein ACE5D0_03710 [Fidelibacterota bacterium]